MADQPGGGSGIHKQVLGQPVWLWAVGAVIVVGGYWYFSHRSSSSTGSTTPSSGSGQDKSTNNENLKETITDWQGGGSSSTKSGKGDKKVNPGGPNNPGGPERQWLIHKTGSQHPWTWLAQHGEQIRVGPHGSRKVIKDQ